MKTVIALLFTFTLLFAENPFYVIDSSITVSCSLDYDNGLVIFKRTPPLDFNLRFRYNRGPGRYTAQQGFRWGHEHHYVTFENAKVTDSTTFQVLPPSKRVSVNPHLNKKNIFYRNDTTILHVELSKLKKNYSTSQTSELSLYNDSTNRRLIISRQGNSRETVRCGISIKSESGSTTNDYPIIPAGAPKTVVLYRDLHLRPGKSTVTLLPFEDVPHKRAAYTRNISATEVTKPKPLPRYMQAELGIYYDSGQIIVRSDRPLPEAVPLRYATYKGGERSGGGSHYLRRGLTEFIIAASVDPATVDRKWYLSESAHFVIYPGRSSLTINAGQIIAERKEAFRIAEEQRIAQERADSIAKVEAAQKRIKNAQARRRERFKIEEWHVIVILLVLFTWITVPTAVVIPKVDPITGKKIPTKVYLQEAPLFLWLLLLIYAAPFVFAILTIFHDAGLMTLPQLDLDTMIIFLIFIPIGVAILALGGTIFGRRYRKVFASILITDLVVVALGVLAAIMAIGAIGI